MRGIAQTLSYEVNLTLLFFNFSVLSKSARLKGVITINSQGMLLIPLLFMLSMLFILAIIETNRTPFDFAEGESELVSGFNTEYSSGVFAIIFLAEYARILFFRLLLTSMFFRAYISFLSYGILTSFAYAWMWVRATFPRYRYDLMVSLA